MQTIHSCLWFNNQAQEAAELYTSLFNNSSIKRVAHYGKSGSKVSGQKEGSVMTVEFTLENLTIVALNGGPLFEFTPALSFFVWCETEEEINRLWQKLYQGGEVRMGLDQYPWAPRYGWTRDKFGVEWQLMLSPHSFKIAPALLFVKEMFGKGEEALQFYLAHFQNSKIDFMARDEATHSIAHCLFTLAGQPFVIMDGQGPHDYTFTHAFSFIVNCTSQMEVDDYWSKLSAGGVEEPCGWLRDRFGISWQVVPTILPDLMSDPKKSERVMKAALKMKKINIEKLQKAAQESAVQG